MNIILEGPQQFQVVKECFKKIMHVGGTTWMNICDGLTTYVPWGTIDWIVDSVLIGMLFILAGLVVVGVIYLIKEVRNRR